MKIGYARVSSIGQSLETQIEKLEKAGCEEILSEKMSATSSHFTDRKELATTIRLTRKGDIFMVTKIDRLVRTMIDLFRIVERLDKT